jgi:hypothetical protein
MATGILIRNPVVHQQTPPTRRARASIGNGSLTRIVELTEDHISRDQEHTYLAVNQHPFVLPPKLARLIDVQLRHSRPRHSTTADVGTSCPAKALDARVTPSASPTH